VSYNSVCDRDECLQFLVPPNLPPAIVTSTLSTLAPASLPPLPDKPSPVKWSSQPSSSFSVDSPVLTIRLPTGSGLPKQMNWHKKGDYVASVCMCISVSCLFFGISISSFPASGEGQGGVWIHQISRRHSQAPFKNIRGTVQIILFHPLKPHFFVAVSVTAKRLPRSKDR
jgi:ribosome biogenesis protein ERB1